MPLTETAKHLTLATGLYRPARWLSTYLRPKERMSVAAGVAFLRALLPPGAFCFDVYANIGARSVTLLETGASVIAIEPNARVVPELRARCGHHPTWTLIEAAVGREAGIATLYARRAHGASSLSEEWDGEIIGQQHVPVVTLDAVIQRFGVPDYCKIDVEGWEPEVLAGLSQPLPLLSFEFHLSELVIPRTVTCLDRLAALGDYEVNVTPAETSRFLWDDWRPLADVRRDYPASVRAVLDGPPYGDLYVRMRRD